MLPEPGYPIDRQVPDGVPPLPNLWVLVSDAVVPATPLPHPMYLKLLPAIVVPGDNEPNEVLQNEA